MCPLLNDLVAHAEIVEIHEATRGLRRIVEQCEAVAHKVRQRVHHPQRLADRGPLLAVAAMEETGAVGPVAKIAFHLQVDDVVGQWHAVHLHRPT
jgi:hypothetical protein